LSSGFSCHPSKRSEKHFKKTRILSCHILYIYLRQSGDSMVFAKLFEDTQKRNRDEAKVSTASSNTEAASPPKSHSESVTRNRKSDTPPLKGKARSTDHNKSGSLSHKRHRGVNPVERQNGSRRKVVSQEALSLSRQLQELSRQKRLDQALKVYWSSQNDKIRDSHHACIVVDCCSRCGMVEKAEKIVADLRRKGSIVNVETETALLKGYAHSGMLHAAMDMFRQMCQSKFNRPNVRTLNTLLRGCMWTASTKRDGHVAGGVISSEEAWQLYTSTSGVDTLDSSSYEYSITLLTQALRIKQATRRIEDFRAKYGINLKGKASFSGGDQSGTETLAVAYLGLARAFALRGDSPNTWLACQRVLNAVKLSQTYLMELEQVASIESSGKKRRRMEAQGGKRAWKKGGDDKSEEKDNRRASSNSTFRTHRLSEIAAEAKALIKVRGKYSADLKPQSDLASRLMVSLFYFSGGGTTNMIANKELKQLTASKREDPFAYIIPTWTSFGLSELTERAESIVHLDENSIRDGIGSVDVRALRDDGTINFDTVFGTTAKGRPLDIELGAGFGDWIARQAFHRPKRNHIAVELRADRVHQIFAKGTLQATQPLDNLCVVGAESGDFLKDRLRSGSLATVFVNHPEPPTQTFGGDRSELEAIQKGGGEPAHMLTSGTLEAAANSLHSGGRLVIVTDNRWYARLLASTLLKVVRQKPDLFRPPRPKEFQASNLRQMEYFGGSTGQAGVPLYEGQPNEGIGHVKYDVSTGASYFDRLWKSGAGLHAERQTRFILIMYRC
jgi:pentatricopeptide repeat protein